MKIMIYGAGATGCVLAAKLVCTGAELTLVARGAHGKALKEHGLRVITPVREDRFQLHVVEHPEEAGVQDMVFITTKAYSMAEIAPHIPALLHSDTRVIPVCNGVPWWFLFGLDGPLKDRPLTCLDPENVIRKHIPFAQVIGGVIYMAAALRAPGITTSDAPPRCIIGAPDGTPTPHTNHLAAILQEAGFKDQQSTNIRAAIWRKLSWNIAFNPLGVLHRLPSAALAEDPEIREHARAIIAEHKQVGEALGLHATIDADEQIMLAERAGMHKPSMLQDFEAGKTLETEALVGTVVEIAGMLDIPIPTIRQLYRDLCTACNQPPALPL